MSSAKYFQKVTSTNQELMQVQQNIESSLGPVVKNPLVGGTLLEALTLASGANTVSHKLGRRPRGWFLVSSSSSATVYGDVRTATDLNITLTSSGTATISIWIF